MKSLIITTTVILLSTSIVYSQPEETRIRAPSVTAHGEAIITAEPDQAQSTSALLRRRAMLLRPRRRTPKSFRRSWRKSKNFLAKVTRSKPQANPNYRYPQGGKPEIIGYTATNILRIKTATLENVGKLIDAAMLSGANRINQLLFTLKDEQAVQVQALRLASEKAKIKVEEMAGALGLKVVRVLALTENERGVRPVIAQARGAQVEALSSATPTPVEAGTIEVRSSVTLTAEIAPR